MLSEVQHQAGSIASFGGQSYHSKLLYEKNPAKEVIDLIAAYVILFFFSFQHEFIEMIRIVRSRKILILLFPVHEVSFFRNGKRIMAQAGCLENTQAFHHLAEAEWRENRLKAERAWFLDRRERRAKPETEPLLTRWVKSGVFSSYPAAAIQTVFLTPSLSLFIPRIYGCFLFFIFPVQF
jgi:hypothetical protein